jgi:hypothetical protein
VIQSLSTSSRRLAPLTARGPAPGRACAPVSAPLQPGRRPCRAHSNQPPEAGERGTSWLGRSAPRLYGATLARASKITASTSCLSRQVYRLVEAPEAYETMITGAKGAPPQSRFAELHVRRRAIAGGPTRQRKYRAARAPERES